MNDLPTILSLREAFELREQLGLRPGLLPFADWGCANWSCVDSMTNVVWRLQGENEPIATHRTLAEWFRDKEAGVDLWAEFKGGER